MAKKKVKFPGNLHLKDAIVESGRPIQWYADQIGYSRDVVSLCVNGHYKGINIVPKLKQLLNIA